MSPHELFTDRSTLHSYGAVDYGEQTAAQLWDHRLSDLRMLKQLLDNAVHWDVAWCEQLLGAPSRWRAPMAGAAASRHTAARVISIFMAAFIEGEVGPASTWDAAVSVLQ